MLFVVFLDITGIALVAPLLPSIGTELGLTHTQFGFVGSLYGVAQAFSSPVMGAISDARGRKGVFLISLAGATLAYVLLGVGLAYKVVWLLGVSRITVGLVKQTMTIAISFITDETLAAERTPAIATLFSITNVAFIIGAPLGGILSGKFGLMTPVVLSSVLYAAAFALCKWLIEDKGGSLGTKQVCPSLAAQGLKPSEYSNKKAPHPIKEEESVERGPIFATVLQEFKGLTTDMINNHSVRKVAIASFLSTLAVVTVQSSFTSVAVGKYNFTTREASYLISYKALLGAFWMMCMSEKVEKRLRAFGSDNIFPASALLSGVALVCQARASTVYGMMTCMLFGSLGDALFKVFLSSLFTKLYEAEIGAAQGIFGNIESLCRVAAPALSGLLLDVGGLAMPWTFAGALNIIVASYCHSAFSALDDPANADLGLQAVEPEKSAEDKKKD